MSRLDGFVGSRIRFYRKQNGMSVQELALQLQKKATTIYKYEQGLISLDINTLYQIADILGVHLFQLLNVPAEEERVPDGTLSGQESHVSRLYCYHYDGFHKRIIHSRIDLFENAAPQQPMAILSYDRHGSGEDAAFRYFYHGTVTRFDYIVYFNFQNNANEAEYMNIMTFNPWNYAGYTWGILCGILDHPLTPASCKVLVSQKKLSPKELTVERLSFSTEELEQMKDKNIFALFY